MLKSYISLSKVQSTKKCSVPPKNTVNIVSHYVHYANNTISIVIIKRKPTQRCDNEDGNGNNSMAWAVICSEDVTQANSPPVPLTHKQNESNKNTAAACSRWYVSNRRGNYTTKNITNLFNEHRWGRLALEERNERWWNEAGPMMAADSAFSLSLSILLIPVRSFQYFKVSFAHSHLSFGVETPLIFSWLWVYHLKLFPKLITQSS